MEKLYTKYYTRKPNCAWALHCSFPFSGDKSDQKPKCPVSTNFGCFQRPLQQCTRRYSDIESCWVESFLSPQSTLCALSLYINPCHAAPRRVVLTRLGASSLYHPNNSCLFSSIFFSSWPPYCSSTTEPPFCFSFFFFLFTWSAFGFDRRPGKPMIRLPREQFFYLISTCTSLLFNRKISIRAIFQCSSESSSGALLI